MSTIWPGLTDLSPAEWEEKVVTHWAQQSPASHSTEDIWLGIVGRPEETTPTSESGKQIWIESKGRLPHWSQGWVCINPDTVLWHLLLRIWQFILKQLYYNQPKHWAFCFEKEESLVVSLKNPCIWCSAVIASMGLLSWYCFFLKTLPSQFHAF